MSQNAIKCPWNKYILLPEDLSVFAGTDCICPAACPDRKANRQDCLFEIFKTRKDSAALPPRDVTTYSYTPDEMVKQFPDYAGSEPEVAATTVETQIQQPVISAPQQQVTPAASQYQSPTNGTAQSNTFGSYVLPVFGNPAPAQSDANRVVAQSAQNDAAKLLTPKKHYNSFELRGTYYTLDGRGGTMNLKEPACAESLYHLILRTFDIESVFNYNGVKDEFLWVLGNTLFAEKRTRAIQVLQNEDFENPTKFFLLFYHAIFSDKKLPLYWADGFSPKLQPIYNDITDFYSKIAEGRDSDFYNNNAELTLLWLKKITLSDLTDSEKIRDSICKVQEEVALDKTSNVIVFWSSSDKFVSLGRKDVFVKNLIVSDKSIEELENTAEFLMKFDIVRQLGQYRVVKRNNPDNCNLIKIADDECNDDIISVLFSRDRSMEKLETYLYIVKRYCDLFRPRSVKIGSLTFEEGRYTEQIESLVMTMCSYVFGDAATDEQKRKAHNEAMLAKILYKNKVIFEIARASRSETYMEDLLSLVTKQGYNDSLVSKYMEVCHRNGIDDRVKLYSYDCSVMPRREKLFSVCDWMCGVVRRTITANDLRALLRTPVFRAYKEVLGAGDKNKTEADNLYNVYSSQESKVLEILSTL